MVDTPKARVALGSLARLILRAVLRGELTLAKAAILLALLRVPSVAQLVRICTLFLSD